MIVTDIIERLQDKNKVSKSGLGRRDSVLDIEDKALKSIYTLLGSVSQGTN